MSMPAARWAGLTLGLLLCCIYTMHSVARGATGATFLASFGVFAGITPPVCSHPPASSGKLLSCSQAAVRMPFLKKGFLRCILWHPASVT